MKKIVSAGAIGLLVAGMCSLPAAGQGAEEIRAKMIEVQGGDAAFRGVKDMTAKGTLDIVQQGLTGNLIVYKKDG